MVKIAKNKSSTRSSSSGNKKKKGVSTEDKNGKKKKKLSLKQIEENMTAEEKEELLKLHRQKMNDLEDQWNLEAIAYRKMKEEELKKRLVELGYVFIPTEGQLVDYYLKNKSLCNSMDLCPIEEVDVYANHPQALAEKHPNQTEVWYFFTRSRPNEIQACPDVQGQWVVCEKKDVFNQGKKVGVKQLLDYCEGDQKSAYKIIEYQLDPAPENLEMCSVDLNATTRFYYTEAVY